MTMTHKLRKTFPVEPFSARNMVRETICWTR